MIFFDSAQQDTLSERVQLLSGLRNVIQLRQFELYMQPKQAPEDSMVQARQIMQQVSDAGGRFAIDDFGTGYSSLAYLSQLPLHQLKIDQSFVRNMIEHDKDRQIVKTIIEMASSLGLEVIAEGVETPEQREQLYQLGCRFYQGYLIGRPSSVGDFEQWLQQHG